MSKPEATKLQFRLKQNRCKRSTVNSVMPCLVQWQLEKNFLSCVKYTITFSISLLSTTEFWILALKTKLRCFQQVKAAQSLFPVNCRSSSEGTGDNACTHNRRRFISRSINWRSVHLRSARTHLHESSHFSKERAVPFGFWCGGFSSTAGYVSGNDAQACDLSDYATRWRSFPMGATRFYPGAFGKSCDFHQLAFRLQRGANEKQQPPATPRERCVTALLLFSSLVTIPVSVVTGCALYGLRKASQAENTLSIRRYTIEIAVEKSVENPGLFKTPRL